MRQQVVVRLFVDLPDEATSRGVRWDAESTARRYVAELLGRLPAGMLADFEVLRVEQARPGKALWSE